MDVYVHAIETGDDGGYHQGDTEARHAFHDVVHVVRDDGSKSIHCASEDVAIDVHRVVGLAQFDDGVVSSSSMSSMPVFWKMFFRRPISTSLPRMEVSK